MPKETGDESALDEAITKDVTITERNITNPGKVVAMFRRGKDECLLVS